MKKIIKENLKKIIALLLVTSMATSFDLSVFAQDEVIEDVIVEESNDIILEGTSGISDEDEYAREDECMQKSPYYLTKFFTYLNRRYPNIGIEPQYLNGNDYYNAKRMSEQHEYSEIIIDGDYDPELTKNMVQFRLLSVFDGNTGGGTDVDNDTVKTLIIRNVDEIRNLSIPKSVETLFIENTTINCYKTPIFQEERAGDLKYCNNLKKLVIRNVKFGDNYKHPELEKAKWEGPYEYETNYRLNLQNCTNLEELEIDVSFADAREVKLSIDGTGNSFEKLKSDKCTIKPAPGTEYGQVILYADENSKLADYYNSLEGVKFKNPNLRLWLLEAGYDTNNDGVISQVEMDSIETLTINNQTARSVEQFGLDDFKELADIEKMHKLKSLELDYYDPSGSGDNPRYSLKGIDFPQSLENLSMKNIYWSKGSETKTHDNVDIILDNLKTLELYNTNVDSDTFPLPEIVLTDTKGALQSCIIEKTDVKSIKLINNSGGEGVETGDEKKRIRFSASKCDKLESIEFLGEGYAVEGGLDLANDIALTHIGVPSEVNGNKLWTVYGEFDMTGYPVNVNLNSCKKLGTECDAIVIDYGFVNGIDLNVQALNTTFSESHQLTIKREPREDNETAGTVFLSCDSTGSNKWVFTKYKDEPGFVIENRSSFPTIAVFANGQNIRTEVGGGSDADIYTEDTRRWVERWDLMLPPRGYSNNFGNLTYYVVDKNNKGEETLRRVFYEGDVYAEWDKPIIALETEDVGSVGSNDEKIYFAKLTGTKLSSTGTPGEVLLKLFVYEKNDDGSLKTDSENNYIKSYIGFQNIKIYELPGTVELVNDGTERGSGTKDDPYIVDKEEKLQLKARLLLGNGESAKVDTATYALRDVIWRIKEYDETPKYTSDSDGYSLYTLDSATKAGISVVRGEFAPGENEEKYDRDRRDSFQYNHRRFDFNTKGIKYKIVAQSPYKNNDIVIAKEVFVEYHSKPLSINISNDIVHGEQGSEETTITIDNIYNIDTFDISIKKPELNPELYDDCFTLDRDTSSGNGKEVWKLKINSSDIVKVKNIIKSNNGSITLVIKADGKTYEDEKTTINISSVYLDSSIDVSNKIIHGKKGFEEATITIDNVYNIDTFDISIKNPDKNPEFDDCFILNRDTSSGNGKEVWKLKINNSDIAKVKDIIKRNNGSITLVINADGKPYEATVELSSLYPDTGVFWCAEIEDQVYTGKAVKPKLSIYYGDFLLEEGKDYTLSYSNNIKAALKTDTNKPAVTVNGIGNYSDKKTYYFSIKPCSIENSAKVDDILVANTKKDIRISPTVVFDGKKLKQGVDYVVSTSMDEKDAIVSKKDSGEYSLYVVGKGNYVGAIPFKFTITSSVLASKVTIKTIANQKYDGTDIKPDVSIAYNRKDVADCFDIAFENNKEIGTATVIIKAKKNASGEAFIGKAGYGFAGSKKTTFKITGTSIKSAKLGESGKDKIESAIYSGAEYKPDLNVYVGATPLKKNDDYTVTYAKNINAGTATATITGKGKYTGTKKFTYKINKYDAGNDAKKVITINNGEKISASYEKGGVLLKPTISMNGVMLTEKKDYTLSYANNKAVAKAGDKNARGKSIAPTLIVTFKGNFSGKKPIEFTITSKDIAAGKITLLDKPVGTKANAWKQTAATIVDTNGKKLVAGTDYNKTFEYYSDSECKNVITDEKLNANTTVYVKITGVKNYEGSYIVGSYRISNKNISTAVATIGDKTYTGVAICPAAEDIKVTVGPKNKNETLKAGIDYEVIAESYTNNINRGTASVTIRGIGDYYGTKVVKYRIGVNKILWWN